tara:strand:- start:8505 stop:9194 length:690 start_codon:yes stop_codon:yes gene_type:complete
MTHNTQDLGINSTSKEGAVKMHAVSKMLQEKAAHFEQELLEGFAAVQKYEKTVTFFGSARLQPDNQYYQQAQELSARICKKGYTVITGGGGGIMEAGNRGSQQACNNGVGFNIELPMEQATNRYVTDSVNFTFFASRKMALYFSGEAYVFFPGGYGTLDEFFQILTLLQTHKAPYAPVICVGSAYWNPVMHFAQTILLETHSTISPEDLNLFTITDDLDEVERIIESAN